MSIMHKLLYLIVSVLQIGMVLSTICHFSRPSQQSPTGWVDLTDTCKQAPDAVCFSGYNPRIAYYHEAVGWWRVLHSEDECFTTQYLRKKLACSSDQELPKEGCFRDKNHYKSFFLCWCSEEKCNTREKITQIYKDANKLYAVEGGCKPLAI